MKVSKKYYRLVFVTLVSVFMSSYMSIVLTLMNVGFGPSFWEKCFSSFAIGFAVSYPVSLVVIPKIKQMVDNLTAD